MAITLAQATTTLLSGKILSWGKSKGHKSGSVALDEPAQRRLCPLCVSELASEAQVKLAAGARYFKRLRCRDPVMVLESLNPDGTTAAEILSSDGSLGYPRLTHALEVLGMLFEFPRK